MWPGNYSEDSLVEQPAIQLFAELGWETLSDEVMGASGTLGRETKSEVVLAVRLRNVLARLNPSLPPEAISAAVDELSRDRSAMLPTAANRELWALMRDGVKVSVPDLARGGQKDERVRDGRLSGGAPLGRERTADPRPLGADAIG